MNKTTKKSYKSTFTLISTFIILALQSGIWAYVWLTKYAQDILRPFGYKGNWLVVVVYALILSFFTSFYGGYKIGYYKKEDVNLSSILALVISNTLTYLQSSLIGRALLNIWPFLIMTIAQSIVIIIWAGITNRIYLKKYPPYKMLLVYGGDKMARSLIGKMVGRSEKYSIYEVVDVTKCDDVEKLEEKLNSFEAVILCDLPPKMKNTLIKYCFENSIRAYTTPKISDIIVRGAEEINLFDTPLILNRNHGLSLEQRFLKRSMDIVISVIMLIVGSPFMLLTALAIKLYDGGPVFFHQTRCTKDNKQFELVKFRSMIVDAEKDGKPQPAVDNDERITPVGKIIRATRLDELPQLFNILKGEMSLVGPRPERIEHVEMYTEEMPEFSMRTKMKAGLTGYAQVVGRYNTSAYDKLKLDLMYITQYSVFMDIKLILMTVKIMFVKNSTEGFEEKKRQYEH